MRNPISKAQIQARKHIQEGIILKIIAYSFCSFVLKTEKLIPKFNYLKRIKEQKKKGAELSLID
jgi:hypothetical protein